MAYETNPDDNNIQAAIDAGAALGTPHELASNYVGVVLPKGATLQKVDLQEFGVFAE